MHYHYNFGQYHETPPPYLRTSTFLTQIHSNHFPTFNDFTLSVILNVTARCIYIQNILILLASSKLRRRYARNNVDSTIQRTDFFSALRFRQLEDILT